MEELKDISMIIISFLVELFESFCDGKLIFQIQLAIRILMGCSINFIELGVAISKSTNERFSYFLIALLCPALGLTISTIVYLVFSCKFSKTISNFDQLTENKPNHCAKLTNTSFWLMALFKLLGIAISIMLIYHGVFSNDNEFFSKYFTMYGVIDLFLTLSSLARSILEKFYLKYFVERKEKTKSSNSNISSTTTEKDETNEMLSSELKDSYINIFYALFGCFHLALLPLLAKTNSVRSLNEFKKGNIDLAIKFNKKSRVLNKIFIFLFIISTIGLIIGLSFIFQNYLNQPIDCANKNADTFIYIKPGIKTRVYCLNGSIILFFRGTYNNFNELTYNDYQQGFIYTAFYLGTTPAMNTYWFGLNNLNILLEKKNFSLTIVTRDRSYNFNKFRVSDESDGYRLELSGFNYVGYTNLFSSFNGMRFSTFDKDQDNDTVNNCAKKFGEGWWYNNCPNLSTAFYPEIFRMSLK